MVVGGWGVGVFDDGVGAVVTPLVLYGGGGGRDLSLIMGVMCAKGGASILVVRVKKALTVDDVAEVM